MKNVNSIVGADAHIGPIYISIYRWADVGIGPYEHVRYPKKEKEEG